MSRGCSPIPEEHKQKFGFSNDILPTQASLTTQTTELCRTDHYFYAYYKIGYDPDKEKEKGT